MSRSSNLPDRRSLRLPGFDYSDEGWYFITINSYEHRQVFGNICDGIMMPSSLGAQARRFWEQIPVVHPGVLIDEFVVMPNHVHGILWIRDQKIPDVRSNTLTQVRSCKSGSIGSIVRGYKGAVSRWAGSNEVIHPVWQRNYWEHVIRSGESLDKIREYIVNNPLKWEFDRFNF